MYYCEIIYLENVNSKRVFQVQISDDTKYEGSMATY